VGPPRGKFEVKSAIINAYRSARVPTEVSGVISASHFEEGDRVRAGQVVFEISKKRYAVAARAAEQKLRTLQVSVQLAEKKRKAIEALVSQDWSTRQRLLEAEQELAIANADLEAARSASEAAVLDLQACSIKAPFTGIVAERYREAHEAIERWEKLFLLIDTSKVYAVAHVPESSLPAYRKGVGASFAHSSGKRFRGTVAKVGPVINPESRTAKVWLLIDNPRGRLEVGMTGTLGLE